MQEMITPLEQILIVFLFCFFFFASTLIQPLYYFHMNVGFFLTLAFWILFSYISKFYLVFDKFWQLGQQLFLRQTNLHPTPSIPTPHFSMFRELLWPMPLTAVNIEVDLKNFEPLLNAFSSWSRKVSCGSLCSSSFGVIIANDAHHPPLALSCTFATSRLRMPHCLSLKHCSWRRSTAPTLKNCRCWCTSMDEVSFVLSDPPVASAVLTVNLNVSAKIWSKP